MDIDDGRGLAGGVGQDDVACARGHLIDQVLVKFAGRDQLTGDGMRAAERVNGGTDYRIAFLEVVGLVSSRPACRAERTLPDSIVAQPRSVTVVLG